MNPWTRALSSIVGLSLAALPACGGVSPSPAKRVADGPRPSATVAPEGVSPALDASAASASEGVPTGAGYLVWTHPTDGTHPETLWVEAHTDGGYKVVARRPGVLLAAAETLWSVGWESYPHHAVPCDALDRVEDEDYLRERVKGTPGSLPLPVARGIAGPGAGTRWILQSPQDAALAEMVPWEGELERILLAEGRVVERAIQFTGGAEGELWFLLREQTESCGERIDRCAFYAPEFDSVWSDDYGDGRAILDPLGMWATKKLHGAHFDGLAPLFEEVAGRFEARVAEAGSGPGEGPGPEEEEWDEGEHWEGEGGFEPDETRLRQVWQLSGGGNPEGRFVFTYPAEIEPLLDGFCPAPVAAEHRRQGFKAGTLELAPAPAVVRRAVTGLAKDTPFGWSTVPDGQRDAMFRAFLGPR